MVSFLILLVKTSLPFSAQYLYFPLSLYFFLSIPASLPAQRGAQPTWELDQVVAMAQRPLQLPGVEKVDPALPGGGGAGVAVVFGGADWLLVAVTSYKATVSWKDHRLWYNPGFTTQDCRPWTLPLLSVK